MLPSGENVVVAIACHTGYNMEDSLIFNKSSIDRGMFRSTSLKKYLSIIQKNQSTAQDDLFMKPDPTKVTGMRHGSYDKINEKGYAPEESKINNNDVLICKVSPIQPVYSDTERKEMKIYKDNSEVYKGHASAVVDRVWTDIYNNEGYKMIKTRIRSERVPRIGDKFCLDEKTEALTSNGWKFVKDLQMTDKIAVLENDKLEYINPVGIYNRDYNGQMYSLTSTYVNFCVTMDHQMYVKKNTEGARFEHVSANDIVGKRITYKVGGVTTNNVHQDTFKLASYGRLKEKTLDMNAWLVFFGIWIAEGWWEAITSNSTYRATFSVNKQRVKDALRPACELLGFHIVENREKWHINGIQLVKYLQSVNPNNDAVHKHLPDFVWTLDTEQAQLLINSMRLGDGTAEDHVTACYYTSSTQLANDLQRLCLHAGWSAIIRVDREAGHRVVFREATGDREVITKYDSLCVNINKNHLEPMVNPKGSLLTKEIESIEDYNGKVYCLEVPSHVFMMRYNGKISFCGQCSRHG